MKRAMAIKKIEAKKMVQAGRHYRLQTEVFDRLTLKSPPNHLAVMKAALQKINTRAPCRSAAEDFGLTQAGIENRERAHTQIHTVTTGGNRPSCKTMKLKQFGTQVSEGKLNSPLALDSGQNKLQILRRLAQKRGTPKDKQKKEEMLFTRQNWVEPSKSLPAKTPLHPQQPSTEKVENFQDVLMIQNSLHLLERQYGSYLRTIKKCTDQQSLANSAVENAELAQSRRLWKQIGQLKQVVHRRLEREKCSLIGIVGDKVAISRSQNLTPHKPVIPPTRSKHRDPVLIPRRTPKRYRQIERAQSRNIPLSSWEHTDSISGSDHKLP